MTRLEVLLATAFVVMVLGLATFSARPRGDSGEYLLMATAFARHLTPDIRDEDVTSVADNEPALAPLMKRARREMASGDAVVLGSIHRAPTGRYYSFHFWLYSLVAAPLVRPIEFAGGSPVLALVWVNAAAVLAAAWYAFRASHGLSGVGWVLAFLVSGTTYYLPWTGPEALTASSALVSALAAMRGRAGVALFAAGIATAQNPGALALVVLVVGWWFLLGRDPKYALLPGTVIPRLDRPTLLWGAGALCVAIASPLFFQLTFGEPSLIARYTTDRSLVSSARAFSLLFDLNQGMLIGVPGVMLSVVGATALCLRPSTARWRKSTGVAFVLGGTTVLLMLVPSLATHNWNSGCAVFMRYAYWSATPLLATLFGIVACLPVRVSRMVAGAGFVVQLAPVVLNGVTGDRIWYTRHSGIARFVMAHAPGLYNPEPEIFVERTLRRETSAEKHPLVAWPSTKAPHKILVTRPGRARARFLCNGGAFEPASVVEVGHQSRYLNGPFRCKAAR